MKTLSKIVYFASLSYILICCLVALLIKALPIEFKSNKLNELSSGLFYFGIPIAILFTIARLGFKNIAKFKIGREIVKTLVMAFVVFAIFFSYAFVSFGSSMCDTVTGETLFIKQNSSSSKIVKRYFGCGAADSSPATITIAKQTEIFSLFWYYTGVDTTTLNKAQWIRVKE